MAIDKKLQIFDDEGNPVDYDILASDVKFNDGKDLPTKLAEMEEEIGEGGYTPPQGGIPKTDLAPSVQQTLDDVANKVDKVPGKGLSTNDYTTEDKTKLVGLPTNPVQSISVNGGTAQTPTNGNVNVVVPTVVLDDVPTAGSNNGVKSGGVKTALDNVIPTINENGKWVIGGVATDKDAQGPRGNTVLVNENAVGIQGLIVNNVSDGGETDILSAEMGKVIRQNIMRIFNALGTYAFPEGKPILSWGSTVINHSINTNGVTGGLTISDVEVDGSSVQSMPQQVVEGKSLSFRLNLPSNLYIYDTIAISMGGVTITNNTGVWDESTGEVNIAAVTDDVIVTATSLTYVSNGLESMFDGMNRGGVTGEWADQKDSTRKVVLTNCTEALDHVEFNGSTSKAFAASTGTGVDVPRTQGTIESVVTGVVCDSSHVSALIFANHLHTSGGTAIPLMMCSMLYSATFNNGIAATFSQKSAAEEETTVPLAWLLGKSQISSSDKLSLSLSDTRAFINNTPLSRASGRTYVTAGESSKLGICSYIDRVSGDEKIGSQGSVFCIRIYNRTLDEAEVAQNYKVDKKRFNLQ